MGIVSFLTTLMKFILGLKKLWDDFLEAKKIRDTAEAEAKRIALSKSIDSQKAAQTESDFDKLQDDIVSNQP